MTSYDVQPGDIYSLGSSHRLMCGDATNKEDVKRLFDGRKPTLVVTSPPYAKQRDYDRPIACWDTMMLGAMDGHDFTDDVQILVNLGTKSQKGNVVLYWMNWLKSMQTKDWNCCGMYVWDKLEAIPGANIGTLRPAHEFVFHFRKQPVLCNLTEKNKRAGEPVSGSNYRAKSNDIKRRGSPTAIISQFRVPDSVIRLAPEKANKTKHPAVFPVSLPKRLLAFWLKPEGVVYDSFAGSGTTLHAAEQEGVSGLGMEISPIYTAIALARWAKAYPEQPITKVAVAP